MNSKLKEQQQAYDYSPTNNSFNFELWASAVKNQMLAALEKRNLKRQTKQ